MSLQPGHRRLATVVVTVLVFVALLFVGTTVQVPFVALGPGPTVNTLGSVDDKEVVDISGVPTDPTTGNLNLTTVSVTDGMSLFQALGMWMSGTYTLEPRDRLFPPDSTPDQVREQNQQDMTGSEDSATIAALRYLDRPTELGVATVAGNGPATEVLKPGDQVISVGGTPVSTSSEMQAAVKRNAPGTALPIEIDRGGVRQTVTVTLAARPDDPKVGYLGVTPEVVNADPALKISYNVGDIGGPSAGMMLTLAVIDRLSPGELTHGKFIAGTGTIDENGTVGPIGGITHKTRAARDAGATVFLVPQANCAEAASDAPDGLTLVKVDNLQGAVDSLDAIGDGKSAPHC
ncbi:PDZ domain-containing protein [Gordonia sp. ABSL11-1]|uniref:YlbL family protein n=1 Tax=Gordonia sp. ABSL11-1 TaxID=3053924 RepID=UPI0025733CA9|nr:PDZ domain-containing protein [Gordonia sp. ABSL11-1]MDL9947854.1 PDZ domain-containing protein [Gordonia sp. ABSL11-1]